MLSIALLTQKSGNSNCQRLNWNEHIEPRGRFADVALFSLPLARIDETIDSSRERMVIPTANWHARDSRFARVYSSRAQPRMVNLCEEQ